MEEQIKLAAKIYGMRDTVKGLHKADYQDHIQPYIKIIKGCMLKHGITNELKAAMHICNEAEGLQGAGIFILNIMAAAAELIEPTK